MMAKPDVPDLVISVDLGGSLTKIAASTHDGQHCLLALASEVASVPLDTLQDIQKGMWGEGSPESVAWIGVKNGSAYAVGELAREKFKSQIDLKIAKTELAVPKILSALWVLQQKLGLGKTFYARLGVLLPAGECSGLDRDDLMELLKPALSGFTTPTGKMSVRLFNKPVIKPEGAGVFLHHKQKNNNLQQRRIGILGIGYRNTNLLVCDRGTIGDGDRLTSDLGFHTLIERCREQVGSTTSDIDLAAIIAKAGYEVNSRIVKRFLADRGRERRLDGFIEAIAKSQSMYLSLFTNWLKLVKADRLDELVFYGGTAEYFRLALNEQLRGQVERISWHSADSIITLDLLELSATRYKKILDNNLTFSAAKDSNKLNVIDKQAVKQFLDKNYKKFDSVFSEIGISGQVLVEAK